MKELFLTVTEMTFLLDGEVLGFGQTVATAPGPEKPGDLPRTLAGGIARMGTFLPAGNTVPRGRWEARLEGQEGYALTFRGERFLLSGGAREVRQERPAQPARRKRAAR